MKEGIIFASKIAKSVAKIVTKKPKEKLIIDPVGQIVLKFNPSHNLNDLNIVDSTTLIYSNKLTVILEENDKPVLFDNQYHNAV